MDGAWLSLRLLRLRVAWQRATLRQRALLAVGLAVGALALVQGIVYAKRMRHEFRVRSVQLRYRREWCGEESAASGSGGGDFDGVSTAHESLLRSLKPGDDWAGDRRFFDFLVQQTLAYRDMFCRDPLRRLEYDAASANSAAASGGGGEEAVVLGQQEVARPSLSFNYHIPAERAFVLDTLLPRLPVFEDARVLFPVSRGLVFTIANKDMQLESVVRTMDLLKRAGSKLPAEVWTFDGATPEHALCARSDVTCRDGRKTVAGLGLGPELLPATAYEYCIYAIFFSGFREVINLDYDAAPLGAVDRLFLSARYKESGQLFYSDWWGSNTEEFGGASWPDTPLWALCKVKAYPCRELESGILLIDKARNWKELNVALHFTRHEILMPLISPTGYEKVLWGDKDVWRVAFMMLHSPFAVGTATMLEAAGPGPVNPADQFCNSRSFGHIDPDDPSRVLFVHQPKTLELPFIPAFSRAIADLRCSGEPKYTPHHVCRACWAAKAGAYDYRTGQMHGVASEWVHHKCASGCDPNQLAVYAHNETFV